MNKSGFTLVEVLIAGALFVVVFSGFGFLLKTSVNYIRRERAGARAFYSARSEMERLRLVPFEALPSFSSGNVTILPMSDDLYLIDVKVKDGMRSFQLTTLRSRY